jgi:hypothetical protein
MPEDVFHFDDRIIDKDTDNQREYQEGNDVQAEANEAHQQGRNDRQPQQWRITGHPPV